MIPKCKLWMTVKIGVPVFFIFFVLFIVVALNVAAASTIYVPDDYALIQDAVDAASPGDTIIVREGTYEENIEVDISLTIRSENGPDSTVVRAEYPDLPVFKVTADYVNINGFTVKGAYEGTGIDFFIVDFCNVSNNICSNNEWGIEILLSNNNRISNNSCSYNTMAGILLGDSCNNSISNNKFSSNINVSVYLMDSCNNSISNNTCSNSIYGIFLASAANNNSILNNICLNNEIGIRPFMDSNNNDIYLNNFMNNDVNAGSYESSNTWSSTSKINYTYNGKTYTNYLGNYWDDYSRSDRDKDGIGDSSYRIDGDRDRHPLMEPWGRYFA